MSLVELSIASEARLVNIKEANNSLFKGFSQKCRRRDRSVILYKVLELSLLITGILVEKAPAVRGLLMICYVAEFGELMGLGCRVQVSERGMCVMFHGGSRVTASNKENYDIADNKLDKLCIFQRPRINPDSTGG